MSHDTVRLKRVYEVSAREDGYRILVDRLWPRGVTKDEARVDLWMKAVAPSTELRRWYHKDTTRWPEFHRRYMAELVGTPALDELRQVVREHTRHGGAGVTMLYGAKDTEHNHAIVLREVLQSRAVSRRGR